MTFNIVALFTGSLVGALRHSDSAFVTGYPDWDTGPTTTCNSLPRMALLIGGGREGSGHDFLFRPAATRKRRPYGTLDNHYGGVASGTDKGASCQN